jgi:hypothetical protein
LRHSTCTQQHPLCFFFQKKIPKKRLLAHSNTPSSTSPNQRVPLSAFGHLYLFRTRGAPSPKASAGQRRREEWGAFGCGSKRRGRGRGRGEGEEEGEAEKDQEEGQSQTKNLVQIGHLQSAASASSWLEKLVGPDKCRQQQVSQNVCPPACFEIFRVFIFHYSLLFHIYFYFFLFTIVILLSWQKKKRKARRTQRQQDTERERQL